AQRIASTFDITVITGIIRLIAAPDARLIISFLDSIRELHQKKPFVKVGSREFGTSIVASVLTLLLVEKTVFFDAPTFLENYIRRIALRYNLGFTQLLVYLIQGMGEAYNASPDISFFHLLTGLLKEQKKAAGVRDPIPGEGTAGASGEQTTISVRRAGRANGAGYGKYQEPQLEERRRMERVEGLRDILSYWLEQGYFPWWGAGYSPDSPEGLWTKLMAQKPEEVAWLVKYAGSEPRVRQRLIYQLPLRLLLTTFRLFPEGNEAVSLYESMAYLLENREEPGLKNESVRQNLLLLALWDGFIASGYRRFDTDIFVARIAFQLSQWTGLYIENIYRSLFKIIVQGGGKIYPERLIRSVRLAWEEGKGTTGAIMKEEIAAAESMDIRLVIGQYLFPGKVYRDEDILRESERIIGYYLTWNKLPDQFPGMTPVMMDIFLKRLLQLLAGERPVRLKAILERETHLSAARMRLHDLSFADNTGTDKSIKTVLEEFRQRDLLRYIAERSGMQQPFSNEKFKEILDHAISHPFGKKEKEFLQSLLSSPAIARQVAERYQEDIVYSLIGRLSAGWGRGTVTFLRQVQSMMVSAIPDKWEREKISLLFRQFNLLFLAGEKTVRNQADYLRLLLPRLADASFPVEMKIAWYRSLLKLELS
ncbi:MAG TPA: contractile injection system tape measure protein, partial [Chitinophagaceae bacterium]